MSKKTKEEEALRKILEGGKNPVDILFSMIAGKLNANDPVYNPGVERTGDKIILPEGADLPSVIDSLQRQHDYEEQYTNIHVTIPVSPWDGAIALMKAIEKNIGVVIQKGSMGGAHQIDVEVELGKTISVPWGSFELPGMDDAEISTDSGMENGRIVFRCHVECKRRFEARVRRLLETVREIAMSESLHRGKAFSIAFRDENGNPIHMPKPKFYELLNEEPIFRIDLTEAIERNVFVPIQYAEDLPRMGESLKRSILFTGNYGVGKTLLASHVARVATAAGWTFIYVKEPKELPEALRYAQQYQPVVVFAEDVDRIAGLARTDEVNNLLNQLDGIDSKSAQIMTILTSNHPDQINSAMMRPGRIDLVLEVNPPDAETVVRMINKFSNDTLESNIDLTAVSELLAGHIPAQIRETISRSKLESLRRTGNPEAKITATDLGAVAKEVKAEAALLKKSQEKESDTSHVTALADGFAGAAQILRKSSKNGSKQHAAAR